MAKVLVAVVTSAVVVAGVWVTGAVLTEDATRAMLLTGGWFAVAGVAALLLARWRRTLAWPVIGAWLVTASVVGGYLFLTSTVDQVVNEDVVTAPAGSGTTSPDAADPSSSPTSAAQSTAAQLVADGRFSPAAHPTKGRAALVRTGDGTVLTLTRFATDPGPDLRVYLVPGDGSSVKGGVDLGALRGNKGNQQYDVPADAPTGAVVIWCRAFSVAFGTAPLA